MIMNKMGETTSGRRESRELGNVYDAIGYKDFSIGLVCSIFGESVHGDCRKNFQSEKRINRK